MGQEASRDLAPAQTPRTVEEQYRLFMECVKDYAIFFLDVQGCVASWNAGAEAILGYAEAEIVGQPLARFFTAEEVERGEPEKELQTAAARGRASDDRFVVRKDGSRLWVTGVTTALRDHAGNLRGFAKVTRDLSERRRAEDALRASAERFRALVENSWDGITLMAADGTILDSSSAAARTLGHGPAELIGRNGFDLIHPEDAPAARELLGRLLCEPGGRVTMQYRLRHKDGSWRWLEGTGTNLLHDPAVAALVVNDRDITERKCLEDELRRRLAELAQADRRKDEFLAVLGHELRNPLAPIRNACHVLRLKAPHDADLRRSGEMIDRQVQHLTRLVDDLLDVSRITRGKVQLRVEPVELTAVVARAVETSRPLIDAQGHELAVTLPAEPVWLEGDATRLGQALANLLNNAAKYTERGGRIRLTAERDGDQAVVRVGDNGTGIAPAMLPRIFDLFLQAERNLGRSQGGLGIGLTLVRALVELHGGVVEAQSDGLEKGSEFIVRLPVRAGAPGRAGAEAGQGGGAGARTAFRVLVVDDNRDSADSVAMLLRLWGHDVTVAYDGPSAVELARRGQFRVVLLDIGLPGMTGYEVARQLRAEAGDEGMLLIAMTGYGQEEDRRRSQAARIDHHLVKPLDPAALLALLAPAP